MKYPLCIRQYLTSLFMLWKNNFSIHEIRTFVFDIYPITSSPKKVYGLTQEGLFMGYTNSRAIIKLWDPHTKRLKYCSSEKFDEHNNKFGKG